MASRWFALSVSFQALAAAVLLTPGVAWARQGTLQISGASQSTTGEVARGATLGRFEPDLGISWLAPTDRLGTLQLEMRGTERGNEIHFGRLYGSARDAKYGGFKWTFEGGDTYYAPSVGAYKFSNLTTPAVTFSGGAMSARSARTDFGVVAGLGTIWRNIFGSDPETLGQTILGGHFTRHTTDRLDVTARASRIRNQDLDEFTNTIAASDQAGGGVRYELTPALQVIADVSAVWYRRVGSNERESDGSGLVGLHWLHSRGWVQANVSRFSPGESPTVNSTLQDRAGQFVAGEFDVFRQLRVFGGWEAFRSNLDASAALAAGYQLPRTNGARQFGGVRTTLGSRSTMTFRAESGDRISKFDINRQDIQSDTGVLSADFQTAIGKMNGFVRVARRSNVTSASRAGSYTQRDLSGQFFLRLTKSTQLFGLATATRTTDEAGGGNTYWQAGGGTQMQLVAKGLWLRTEGTLSRNADLLTRSFVPRESLSVGVNGHLAQRTTVGIDFYLDRAALVNDDASPWATRSIVRVTQSLSTGSPFAPPSSSGLFRTVPARAFATVKGTVYADWNGNGLQDPGENPVSHVPLRIEAAGAVETGKDGDFLFRNVPDGMHDVALDTGSLPIDFDPPRIPRVQVSLSGKDTKQVAFGLIPLGRIRGGVIRDLNGNGVADAGEPSIDGAVVVLDDGNRSERSRRGIFAFEAVQSGEHAVTLLTDSLPEGAVISGATTREATLGRDRMDIEMQFLVSVAKRAELRKVFGAKDAVVPRVAAATPRPAPAAPVTTKAVPRPQPSVGDSDRGFTLQIAAFDDPLRARKLAGELTSTGFAAYIVEPTASNPNAPYRVRVGGFATRVDAEREAMAVAKAIGQRPWITRE
jgi:hypothetical protein